MPPTMTTSAIPRTTKPISPAWRAVSASEDGDRKLSMSRLSAIVTIIRTITGIAVSVQRLERISPSRWSGQYLAFSRTKASCIGEPSDFGKVTWAERRLRRLHEAGVEAVAKRRDFFRSARFQQAVLLSAFSLVIGIRVV